MGDKFKHANYKTYEGLHNPVGSFDGGSCVDRHEPNYMQRNSCSYRWQAHHRATGPDTGLYPGWRSAQPQYRTRSDAYMRVLAKNKALASVPKFWTTTTTDEPRDVGRAAGAPFRTAFAPWSNNAHHLLPNAQLRGAIFAVAGDNPEAQSLIVGGLLEEKYNLNHWNNMMILPLQITVGCRLGLPTHVKGMDFHQTYSDSVRGLVDKVLTPYKALVDEMNEPDADEDHEGPDPLKLKAGLEIISDALHAKLIAIKPLVLAKCAADQDISLSAFSSQVATAMGM